MNKQQNNSLFFRIFSSKILFIIFLIILVYLSMSIYREVRQRLEIKKEISDLKREINNLSNENNQLSDLINYFETEEYIESVSREKLGYKKPGEKIIIVTEGNPDYRSDIQAESSREEEGGSNIKLWWNYFFHNSS